MFTGSQEVTVDDKGRLAIPARFRQSFLTEHNGQVFITRSYSPCIEIYAPADFRAVAQQIDAMADRRKADVVTRVFVGSAVETEIDKQGRVLLPALLRKLARIDTNAVVVGQNKRIEIWSEDEWTAKFSGGEAEALADAFSSVKR